MTAYAYRVPFPDGTSAVTHDRPHVTHAVVVNAGRGWSVWAGFGRDADAADEAACLTHRTQDVQVVPVAAVHPFDPRT